MVHSRSSLNAGNVGGDRACEFKNLEGSRILVALQALIKNSVSSLAVNAMTLAQI